MSTYADVVLSVPPTGNIHFNGAGTQYLVQTSSGVWYQICIDDNLDIALRKSLDGGLTWSHLDAASRIFTGSASQLAVWYDRWSGINGDLIHCTYCNGTSVLYRSINTASSDALSTQTTVFSGVSDAVGSCMSLTRTRGGNLLCAGQIDAGTEIYSAKSVDVGANWTTAAAVMESGSQDQIILLPGWASDNQDAIAIFWDASANEISRKLYDDSADSWAETSIATAFVDLPASTAFPNMSAAVDIANSQNVIAAWSDTNAVNADLRCWKITEAAITETATNVVLNSGDDQGMCATGIDTVTGYWYVFYAGKSDGSEDWQATTGTNIYVKISQDQGATWSSETKITNNPCLMAWMAVSPRFFGLPNISWYTQQDPDRVFISVAAGRGKPRARSSFRT